MQEKSCRCGASKKRFKMDIGPFYVGECCNAAGFDELGRPKLMEGEKVEVSEAENAELDKLVHIANLKPQHTPQEQAQVIPQKLGRGTLMDMKIDDLKNLAKSKGIAGADQMTKRQLVQAIFEP